MSATNRGATRRDGDAYYTPDALAEALVAMLPINRRDLCVEPHVGGGAFARALHRRGASVIGVDIDPDASGFEWCAETHRACDWLSFPKDTGPIDWVIGNPPFRNFGAHADKALSLEPSLGVAFLLRLAVLESAKRADWWRTRMPSYLYPIAKRPSFTGGSTDSCAYGWFVWRLPLMHSTLCPPIRWKP